MQTKRALRKAWEKEMQQNRVLLQEIGCCREELNSIRYKNERLEEEIGNYKNLCEGLRWKLHSLLRTTNSAAGGLGLTVFEISPEEVGEE